MEKEHVGMVNRRLESYQKDLGGEPLRPTRGLVYATLFIPHKLP